MIDFECGDWDEPDIYILDDECEFEDCTASFEGEARGYISQRGQGEAVLTDLYIECVVLIDNDNEHRELSRDELVELENLISW